MQLWRVEGCLSFRLGSWALGVELVVVHCVLLPLFCLVLLFEVMISDYCWLIRIEALSAGLCGVEVC